MNENASNRDESEEGPEGESPWRIDWRASREHLRDFEPLPDGTSGGALVYTDEQGVQRRLPPDMSEVTTQEIANAARATSYALGAADAGYAKIAAIERLNELHSAGAISDENYAKEKRRILKLG